MALSGNKLLNMLENSGYTVVKVDTKKSANNPTSTANKGNTTSASSLKGGNSFTSNLLDAMADVGAPIYTQDDIAPVRTTTTTKKKKKDEEEDDRKWFDTGAFDDGHQFGDVFKTILGTDNDILKNMGHGARKMAENAIDFGADMIGQAADKLGADNLASKMKDFVKKDISTESPEAFAPLSRLILNNPTLQPFTTAVKGISTLSNLVNGEEDNSVLGDRADSAVQSATRYAIQAGLGGAGVPWQVTAAVTSYGAEAENAYNNDASHNEAALSALVSAGGEVLGEYLTGGAFGAPGLDDLATKSFARDISNKTLRSVLKYITKALGEPLEEVFSWAVERVGQKLTYANNKTWKELYTSDEAKEELVDAIVSSLLISGTVQGADVVKAKQQGVDYTSGLTANEEKVVDKVYRELVAKAEKNGKVTNKQKNAIYDEVLRDMERGYISTDTIEEVLGGETYQSWKNTVDSEDALRQEYEELGKKQNATLAETTRYNELHQQMKDLKTTSKRNALKDQLGSEVMGLVQNERLAESYNERSRRGQAYQADISKYDEKQRATIQKAIDSGILNNTNRTHEFVDLVAKITADKGVVFDFTNNERLKNSSFSLDGKSINGYLTKDGVTLNIDSKKSLNSVVGHEITHVLEGTELYTALQNTVFEYAKTKGDYQGRYDALTKLYEGVEGADINAELTADLVGDYLFTDTDFVRNLSVQHRNVFQKIWDEVKYLHKIATAGSKEARELEKVKRAFEDAYKAGGKQQSDTKYSLSDSDGKQLSQEQQEFFKDSKVRDENGSLLVLYRSADGGRTVWDGRGDASWAKGIYLTDDVYVARAFASGRTKGDDILEVYAKAENPLVIDAQGNNYMSIPLPEDAPDWLADSADIYDELNADKLPITAFENGHDAVIIKNVREGVGGDPATDVILRDANQIKRTDNTKPTKDADIRYSLSELDNTYQYNIENEDMIGAELVVEQAANLAMPDSKIRDKSGNLKPVYHGTQDMFYVFDTSVKGGKNGTAEGFGIYTSDDPEVTAAYGDRQIKMFANITKPARSDKKTITPAKLAALIKDTCKRQAQKFVDDGEYDSVKDALMDTWVSNYVYTYDIGMERSYREVAKNILQTNDSDMSVVQEVMAGIGIRDYAEASDFYRNSLTPITGFDGFVTEWKNSATGKSSSIILALNSNQLKSADAVTYDDSGNVVPLSERFNPQEADIRRSLSNIGEEFAPIGSYNVYGKDIALETAPVQEAATDKAEVTTDKSAGAGLTGVSAAEMFPDDQLGPMPDDPERFDSLDDADGQQTFAKEEPKQMTEEERTQTRKQLHQGIMDNIKATFKAKGLNFDNVLKNAKNLSTLSTVDNMPQRVMEKALGYKEGRILGDLTVNKVAQNESEGIKWLNRNIDTIKKISRQYGIKPGSKQSAAAQMYAEGFYVAENNDIIKYGDAELAKDFPNIKVQQSIKQLANDPRIRRIYDETLAAINESRTRNAYPEIPRLDNYHLHFRAMEDTFSRLGLPFNPNDIRAKDLPTDLNGVTADLKPGQPYFASANHRRGKRTSFDLLGGLERYLNSAKNQIYHIDDIQTLRALRNYIAETYGQAVGLENLDTLTNEEAQERIEQIYGSHLSTFAKFLNEEANVIAGKTALIDRGLEGIIGRRGMTFMNSLNGQVGSNMVGFNISSSLTNFLPVAQTFAKTNKFDFTKAFAQTVANKLIGGRLDSFAEDSPVMIRRKGADRFYRTPWQKAVDVGYVFMSAVDDISTEMIARTKYNELTRKGMDPQTAHFETDKWVSRLMGDRSLGQMPQLYNSKMLGLFTKFQLEVRNQLDSQFYDTIKEAEASSEHIQNGLLRNAKMAAKVTSTLVQLAAVQHLYGTAFEQIAGYNPAFDIIEVLITAFGYDDEEDSEDTAVDNLTQAILALAEDLPYTSVVLDGGRIPVSSAIPDFASVLKGEDEYGNEIGVIPALKEEIKEVAPYYLMPGGYGQFKKTKAGLEMYSDEHPIAGSYTDSGNLRFPVEDAPIDKAKAAIFGQYASENARKYFAGEERTLNPDQTKIFAELDMPIEDYWEYRDNLYEFYDYKDALSEAAKADSATEEDILKSKFISSVYSDIDALYKEQKEAANGNSLLKSSRIKEIQKKMSGLLASSQRASNQISVTGKYAEVGGRRYNYNAEEAKWYEINEEEGNHYYEKEQEVTKDLGISYAEYWNNREEYNYAYDHPQSYAIAKSVGGYDEYVSSYYPYLVDKDSGVYIFADKDANGDSIAYSRQKKVKAWLQELDIPEMDKLLLYKSVYNSYDDRNYEIIDYLNGRDDLTFEDRVNALRGLGFNVTDDGNISWK